jgi:hypothetical protein
MKSFYPDNKNEELNDEKRPKNGTIMKQATIKGSMSNWSAKLL